MKIIAAAFILMISMNVKGQNKSYTVSKDPKNDEVVYSGLITFDDLNREPSFAWLKEGRDEYKPDVKSVAFLGAHLRDYSILIFLGTWCSDSQDLVPRLEKVLLATAYPESTVTMYGVDRAKKTKNGESQKYRINLVPTIILLKDNKETGRITETVHKSIERDLAAIIKKDIAGR
jgi:thiol-disulfide isomerase/thioredoxin